MWIIKKHDCCGAFTETLPMRSLLKRMQMRVRASAIKSLAFTLHSLTGFVLFVQNLQPWSTRWKVNQLNFALQRYLILVGACGWRPFNHFKIDHGREISNCGLMTPSQSYMGMELWMKKPEATFAAPLPAAAGRHAPVHINERIRRRRPSLLVQCEHCRLYVGSRTRHSRTCVTSLVSP